MPKRRASVQESELVIDEQQLRILFDKVLSTSSDECRNAEALLERMQPQLLISVVSRMLLSDGNVVHARLGYIILKNALKKVDACEDQVQPILNAFMVCQRLKFPTSSLLLLAVLEKPKFYALLFRGFGTPEGVEHRLLKVLMEELGNERYTSRDVPNSDEVIVGANRALEKAVIEDIESGSSGRLEDLGQLAASVMHLGQAMRSYPCSQLPLAVSYTFVQLADTCLSTCERFGKYLIFAVKIQKKVVSVSTSEMDKAQGTDTEEELKEEFERNEDLLAELSDCLEDIQKGSLSTQTTPSIRTSLDVLWHSIRSSLVSSFGDNVPLLPTLYDIVFAYSHGPNHQA